VVTSTGDYRVVRENPSDQNDVARPCGVASHVPQFWRNPTHTRCRHTANPGVGTDPVASDQTCRDAMTFCYYGGVRSPCR